MKLRILIGFSAVLLTSCQQQSTSLTGDSGVEGALRRKVPSLNPPRATIPNQRSRFTAGRCGFFRSSEQRIETRSLRK
jgi:hypothetical protein